MSHLIQKVRCCIQSIIFNSSCHMRGFLNFCSSVLTYVTSWLFVHLSPGDKLQVETLLLVMDVEQSEVFSPWTHFICAPYGPIECEVSMSSCSSITGEVFTVIAIFVVMIGTHSLITCCAKTTFHNLLTTLSSNMSQFYFSLFSCRLWKQQYEWRHVQCRLPLHHQYRLLLSVHQYNECQAQWLPGYDLAWDGYSPALLPRCVLWCHTGEGHSGRHHGGREVTLGAVPSDGLFYSQGTHRGTVLLKICESLCSMNIAWILNTEFYGNFFPNLVPFSTNHTWGNQD